MLCISLNGPAKVFPQVLPILAVNNTKLDLSTQPLEKV